MIKKNTNIFNAEYAKYWRVRARTPLAGAKVPDNSVADFYIKKMRISGRDKVLDLGCGLGRLFTVINRYSRQIIGIDVSADMLAAAAKLPYTCLIEGGAERTHIASNYVNKIVLWAAFDVMEQEQVMLEASRILKKGGLLLVTGKNYRYRADDKEAFIAERNAKLKDFPNHFTDVYKLIDCVPLFGFKVVKAYSFEKRGDTGKNNFKTISAAKRKEFYEYLLILRKIDNSRTPAVKFAYEYSKFASVSAVKAGFKNDIRGFFKAHKREEEQLLRMRLPTKKAAGLKENR